MRIFANHAHVFPRAVREDGTVDALLRVMDDCGIEKAVAFATFPSFLGPGDEEPNRALGARIASEERLTGFGVIDFTRSDLEEQVEAIAALGFPGIKLHPESDVAVARRQRVLVSIQNDRPAFQRVRVDGEPACRVYAAAERLGLFLSFHTGIHWHRIADYNLLLFDEVAYRFPALRFSLEHVGGYCFFHEAVAVMQNNRKSPPRIYAGLTSVFDRDANRFWYQSDERIRELLWQTGEDASIFGLDFPYNGAEKIRAAIDHICALEISDEAKEKLLGGNLRRVLGLS